MDSVDSELIDEPHHWDIGFIRKFMMVFGITSSVFDYLTFGVILFLLPGMTEQFRTGWFVESVISASIIVLVKKNTILSSKCTDPTDDFQPSS